jgi:hypothetical protein
MLQKYGVECLLETSLYPNQTWDVQGNVIIKKAVYAA